MFPDGTRFYPDIQNGIYGFNFDPQRGADTFRPFRQKRYLIKNGVVQSDVTFTFKAGSNTGGTATIKTVGTALRITGRGNYYTQSVDVTNYDTLKARYDPCGSAGACPMAVTSADALVCPNSNSPMNNLAYNISNMSGNVCLSFSTNANISQYADLYDLWIE